MLILYTTEHGVFQASKFKKTFRPGANTPINNKRRFNGTRGQRFNGQRRNNNRRCYGCSMLGHILAECWHVQQDFGTIAIDEASYTTSFHDSNQFEILEHLCSLCTDFKCSCPDSVLRRTL